MEEAGELRADFRSRCSLQCSRLNAEGPALTRFFVCTIKELANRHAQGLVPCRFSNPLHTTGQRFVWDYWHVPNQYTLLRTPADQFFPEDHYQQLEDGLLDYGEQQLGCRGISPIWLSYYVDGCRQVTHYVLAVLFMLNLSHPHNTLLMQACQSLCHVRALHTHAACAMP